MTSSTCAAPDIQLTIEDLSTVQDVLTPIANKFKIFGSKISIPSNILAGIEKTNCDFDEKLYNLLDYRLKQLPLLTWHDIVRALRSPAVHEQVLASQIESQYIPCSSSQSQLVSPQSSTKHQGSKTKSQQEDRIMHRKRHHSPPHEKSCKRPRKARKPRHTCKKYAKQPSLSQPHSKPLVNMSSNTERLCPSPWSEGLLGEFLKYLKSLYSSCPVEKCTNVLKLPNPGNVFINLAFIDRKTKGLRTEYDEITEAMVRDGNVDVIEGRKCPIDMNKIAANLPTTTLETVILVEGAPGVGKSTFAWEFCRRWERGEIAQQYDLVLLLRLRDDRISKAKCWKDLVYHDSPSILQAVISELEARSGFGVLFILEGYDELPDECRHPSSPLLKLISGEQLHLATLMITSRPWATCDILKKFKHRIFQHIEVLGFTKTQISSYIQSVLSEEEVKDLEEKLLKHGQIRQCMYIPLNCAIVITVYEESKASGDDMPSTMTELYLALSRTILLRYLRANDPDSDPIECFEELPDHVLEKFKSLCKLAYNGVAEAGDQVRLIFTDLPEDFDALGFMDSVFQLYVTRKAVASHNFLHLTFQEFLAAVHISNMEIKQPLEHFKRHKEGRLRVVLRFLAGITKLKDFSTPSSFVGLLDQPRKCGYTTIDYTIRPHVCTWVYEALGKDIIKTAFHEEQTVEFSCDKLSDSAALGYCIAHSCCKWVLSVGGRIEKEEIDKLVDESQTSDYTGGIIVGLRGGFDEDRDTFKGLSVSFMELKSIFTGLHVRLSELALELPVRCSLISWPELSSLQSLTIDTMHGEDETVMHGEDETVMHGEDETVMHGEDETEMHGEDETVMHGEDETEMHGEDETVMHGEDETEMHGEDETVNWELDYLLPKLSLSSLSLWFHPSFLSFEDSKAVANCITNTSTLKYLHILVYCPLIGMEKIFASVEVKELRPHFTLEILDEDLVCDNDAEYLANYIRTTTLSKLVFPLFSAFGALQVAKALRDYLNLREVPDMIDNKLYFYVLGPSDFPYAIELSEYFDYIGGQENFETKEYNISFSFIPPDSTTAVEWGLFEEDGIDDVGLQRMAKALHNKPSIKTLLLFNFKVSDVGTNALAEAINSTNILKLELSLTKIGNVGTEALAQAIRSNTSLKTLFLSSNDIGDVGAIALAQALHSNSSLEVLDLSCNCIGVSGAKAFAEAFHHNSTLTHLDLSWNEDIGEEGVHHLLQALTVNDSISENGLILSWRRSNCIYINRFRVQKCEA